MLNRDAMKVVALALALAAALAGFASAAQNELLAPLDQAANALLGAAGAPNHDASRVVPIVGAGGVTSGYAQIVGPRSRVAATRAVMKISTTAANGWTIDALVPVSAVSRESGSMHREYGVAVDAIVSGP